MAEKKKDNMEILNEIRNFRNKQLLEEKDNRVFFTVVMALDKGVKTGKQLYRIIEEYSVGDNRSQIRELFYEYKDKPELVAIMDQEIYDGRLYLVEEMVDNEEEKDFIISDIQEGRAKAEENAKEQALELGINEKEIESLSEIDINKRIMNKRKEENNKDKLDTDEEKDENKEEDAFELSKEEAREIGIIGMNTMPLDQRVGIHGETLRSELGLNDKEEYSDVVSIEIIPSYKLKTLGVKRPDIPFVPVGRHKDGRIEAFPESICKVYKGENTEVTKIDGQEDKVTREKSSSIIEFVGKNVSLSIDQRSPYGIAEASLAYNTRDNDGRVAINLQDKYDGTDTLDYEARKIVDLHKGRGHYGKMTKEAESHPDGEVTERKDGDGIEETVGHIHKSTVINYEGMLAQFDILAGSIGECHTEAEKKDLLDSTNKYVQYDIVGPEEAFKLALKERDGKLIQELPREKQEMVQEFMREENIKSVKKAIESLEYAGWNKDRAEEDRGLYKGDKADIREGE